MKWVPKEKSEFGLGYWKPQWWGYVRARVLCWRYGEPGDHWKDWL